MKQIKEQQRQVNRAQRRALERGRVVPVMNAETHGLFKGFVEIKTVLTNQ